IKRKFRASAGELGVADIAALQEIQKGKYIIYEAYQDTNCLIELDEQPPNSINQESFETAIQVAKLLNCKLVDDVRVMRKTIVDGSNTSGFQRTSLIGFNGSIETKSGKVGIPNLILEEDSARTIKENSDHTIFRLDRLGIPLLEISTTPEIYSPEQCKEVAEYIGLILRSTGKAKRGIGTIRQDLNISIKEGARIEIKGVQELRLLPLYVELEVLRQKNLLEIKSELEKRKINNFSPTIVDLTQIIKSSTSTIIKSTLEKGGVILGIKLEKCKGLLGREIQPNKRFGTELSGRAKVIAGVGGIIHSDELPKYGITQGEVIMIKQALSCSEEDGFVIVADKKDRSEKALKVVVDRANEALKGIPKEVRGPNEDGTTSYQRPLPGAARMYPETDVPSIELNKELLSKIKLPELIDVKSLRYQKDFSLAKYLADKISRS
ncbi:MAG: Glu-tRNA(Gln) amidotransferase subunit GatE, partial [Nanoarchaeota archaeon]